MTKVISNYKTKKVESPNFGPVQETEFGDHKILFQNSRMTIINAGHEDELEEVLNVARLTQGNKYGIGSTVAKLLGAWF